MIIHKLWGNENFVLKKLIEKFIVRHQSKCVKKYENISIWIEITITNVWSMKPHSEWILQYQMQRKYKIYWEEIK